MLPFISFFGVEVFGVLSVHISVRMSDASSASFAFLSAFCNKSVIFV